MSAHNCQVGTVIKLGTYVSPVPRYWAVISPNVYVYYVFKLKIGTPVTPTLGDADTNFGLSAPFYTRQHVMLSASLLRQRRPSVRPSVCHAAVLCQNDAT